MFYIKKKENYYCLIFASYYSIGDCYDRGNCGCGTENFILYLTFNKFFDFQSQQILFSESCLNSRQCRYSENGNWFSEISGFDLNNFVSYEIEIADIRNKRETIYKLNSNCLDCGFQVISDKNVEY